MSVIFCIPITRQVAQRLIGVQHFKNFIDGLKQKEKHKHFPKMIVQIIEFMVENEKGATKMLALDRRQQQIS